MIEKLLISIVILKTLVYKMFKIKSTKLFDKRFANLGKYFDLSTDDINDAIEAIKFSMLELRKHGQLPEEYDDHVLEDAPWTGFNEYHVLDDLLVIYYKVDKRKTIRFTTITTHKELRKGTL